MEDRKTIFDYLGMVLLIYGFMMIFLMVFSALVGESTKEFSSMFKLGSKGVAIDTMAQFLLAAVCEVFVRFLFFSDVVIKRMSVALRTACMVVAIVGIIAVFIVVFDWFPTNMVLPWVMFFVWFVICFVASIALSILKERMENKKMEEALERLKKKEKEQE